VIGRSLFLLSLIWSLASAQKFMAITIDDLPFQGMQPDTLTQREVNRRIVEHLTAAGVPAIGFVNESKLYFDGRLSDYQVQTLAWWTDRGLELGNHTFSHKDYNRTPNDEFFDDIRKGETVTRQLVHTTGGRLRYFRHPFLRRGNSSDKVRALENFLKENGYIEAPVTVDNSEWIYARAYEKAVAADDTAMQRRLGESYLNYMIDKTRYFEREADSLFGRNISQVLLIHANRLNALFLGELIDRLRLEGYTFVTLTDALTDSAYRSDDTLWKGSGISWLHRWAMTRGKDKSFFAGEPVCPDFVQSYAEIRE
jgi:peptidoglycan/xylan/chitin deacetylase (PgdA/CDA1 family)